MNRLSLTSSGLPPRLIEQEQEVDFPVLDVKGNPVSGTSEFQWKGDKIFTTLYKKKFKTYVENPIYVEVVRDEQGRFLGRKYFDFVDGVRIEQVGKTDAIGNPTGTLTAQDQRNRAIQEKLNKLEELILSGGVVKQETKVDETTLTEEEKTLWDKIKSKVGFASLLFFAFITMSFASCSTQQQIAKAGCTIHEFAIVKQDTANASYPVSAFVNSVDSIGIYMVCDNAKLTKNYPNTTAKVLSYYTRLKGYLLSR